MNVRETLKAHAEEAEVAGPGRPDGGRPSSPERKSGRGGHSRWMMIACCVPMLAIAIALVATGVVGAGLIVIAVACTVLMAAMMAGMSHGGGGDGGGR